LRRSRDRKALLSTLYSPAARCESLARDFQSAKPARLCAKDVYVLLEQLRANAREDQGELSSAGDGAAVGFTRRSMWGNSWQSKPLSVGKNVHLICRGRGRFSQTLSHYPLFYWPCLRVCLSRLVRILVARKSCVGGVHGLLLVVSLEALMLPYDDEPNAASVALNCAFGSRRLGLIEDGATGG
jgi:hypothetical protein